MHSVNMQTYAYVQVCMHAYEHTEFTYEHVLFGFVPTWGAVVEYVWPCLIVSRDEQTNSERTRGCALCTYLYICVHYTCYNSVTYDRHMHSDVFRHVMSTSQHMQMSKLGRKRRKDALLIHTFTCPITWIDETHPCMRISARHAKIRCMQRGSHF